MTQRTRKFIGTIAIITFVMLYGPVAMAIAESRIMAAPQVIQVISYAALGLAWIIPIMPVIRWMQRPDPDNI
ncbi:MAG: protein of unknown function DUF2842 [Saliniramus fredricksonii]|uniref:DUF2842 domain-containing protein n=1 Tax=Saliniramus fredricksonii TaxID=1653334 RepID=A0A0P8A3W3_9HYPH|nr:DUF2842 domain-containing protein [Saliniramus fredricksonii]KPQ09939.1 MAG: protein of unknown function DUF2842 [Saliniramus fredricksonii]SCC80870.1 Protein of unknown function [Saliniramus fredricksonii]